MVSSRARGGEAEVLVQDRQGHQAPLGVELQVRRHDTGRLAAGGAPEVSAVAQSPAARAESRSKVSGAGVSGTG
ncbi:hypothetical protein GQ85_42050, partial [Rhodococcus rhodochrous]